MSTKRVASGKNGLFQKTTLKNGLRVITEKIPSVRSISIGIWIDVGSRNEKPSENGLSHFIEHMVFKGTRRRTAKQIASSLESIGGSLNGFTSREHTCFTARVLDLYLEEAIDVLADMSCNSSFTPVNLKREGQVICEEIKEVLDNPADYIHDLFSQTYWGKNPLGQAIMGSPENIQGMTRSKMLKFMKRNYKASSVVVAASGSISHSKLVRLVCEKFNFENGSAEPMEAPFRTRERDIKIVRDKNQQTHYCIGFPGVAYLNPEKITVMVLNSYLGGGMSSALFQKIREEKGLAYTVYSYQDIYRDSGIFGVYMGTDDTHLLEAHNIILKEIRKLKRNRLPSSRLAQVKAQLKGHLLLGMESTSNSMSRIARQELMSGKFYSLKQVINKIDKVTSSNLLNMANQIFDESKMAISVLGPVDGDVFRDVG